MVPNEKLVKGLLLVCVGELGCLECLAQRFHKSLTGVTLWMVGKNVLVLNASMIGEVPEGP